MEALKKFYNGFRDFVDGFANSEAENDNRPRKMENRVAWYAEWDNNYFGTLLENPVTKSVLRKIADFYYGEQLESLLREATELTEETYPKLHGIYSQCCNSLGMYIRPQAYVTGKMKGVNALSIEVKERKVILISPQAAISIPSEEQSFILGHELGHHQQGNLVCHTVNGLLDDFNRASEIFGPLVLDAIEVPLKRWCRCSEFNADRAGYICCRNEEVIRHLFEHLGMRAQPSVFAEYEELAAAHPLLSTRWSVLKQYIELNSNRI